MLKQLLPQESLKASVKMCFCVSFSSDVMIEPKKALRICCIRSLQDYETAKI